MIGVGSDFACALDAGVVSCWGGNSFQLPTFKNPTKIVTNQDYLCVLDDKRRRLPK